MFKSTVFKLTGIALPLALVATAQAANTMTLTTGFTSTQTSGETVGAYGLANIASRDSNGEFCLGYADREPDHVLTLEEDFTELTIAINSGGADTTLLIQSDNTVLCNDNASRQSRDAQIQAPFPKGTYQMWVGSFAQEGRHRYNVTISE